MCQMYNPRLSIFKAKTAKSPDIKPLFEASKSMAAAAGTLGRHLHHDPPTTAAPFPFYPFYPPFSLPISYQTLTRTSQSPSPRRSCRRRMSGSPRPPRRRSRRGPNPCRGSCPTWPTGWNAPRGSAWPGRRVDRPRGRVRMAGRDSSVRGTKTTGRVGGGGGGGRCLRDQRGNW